MTNEELNTSIMELVELIKSQNFQGTIEEIQIQQILFFDKYVKDNIDYGFDAVNYSINNPNMPNPYSSAFDIEGFFKENESDGRRLAVCGSISKVACMIFKELGINSNYVWGHFNIGTEEKPQYVGHRWNIVEIGNKQYMVDFTAGMIIHNMEKDKNYMISASQLLGANTPEQEYKFLFFDKLCLNQSIGGFKTNKNGTAIDDLDENKFLRNITNDPYTVISKLTSLSPDIISQYISKLNAKTL